MTPSPATPTEETRRVLSDERIREMHDSADRTDIWQWGALSSDRRVDLLRFARAVEQAVLAAPPRGEVSEEEKLAAIFTVSDPVHLKQDVKQWSEVGRNYRVIFDAGLRLGLSRGGGDGEAVRKARLEGAREALTKYHDHLADTADLRSYRLSVLTFRDREYPAPAPVVRSVRRCEKCGGELQRVPTSISGKVVDIAEGHHTDDCIRSLASRLAASLPVEASDARQ
jgi:hypothetical protein